MSPNSLPPSSKVPPRFLPTLTEVVSPGPRQTVQPSQEADVIPQVPQVPEVPLVSERVADTDLAPAHFQVEELIERVMDRLHDTIEFQIREVLTTLINDQVRALEPRMVQEVLHAVRQSVTEAVTQDINSQPKSVEFDL